MGRRCRIGQNVVIGPNVQIGNGVKIQNNVSVYEGVTLEDDVFCGPSMVFTNVFNPRQRDPPYGRATPDAGSPRRNFGRKLHDCLWRDDWRICVCRGGSGGDEGRSGFCSRGRQSGANIGWMCACGNRIEVNGERKGWYLSGMPETLSENRQRSFVRMMKVPCSICKLNMRASGQKFATQLIGCAIHSISSSVPEVAALEEEIAAFAGAKFAVGVSSGTDASVNCVDGDWNWPR